MDNIINSVLSVVAGIALAFSAFISGVSDEQPTNNRKADEVSVSICGTAGLVPESAKDDCP